MSNKHIVIGPDRNKVVDDKQSALDEAVRQVGKPTPGNRAGLKPYVEEGEPIPKDGIVVRGDEKTARIYPAD